MINDVTNLAAKLEDPELKQLARMLCRPGLEEEATDLYLCKGARSVLRRAGKLYYIPDTGETSISEKWEGFTKGRVDDAVWDGLYEKFRQRRAIKTDADVSFTDVLRFTDLQIRVHYAAGIFPRTLRVRIQKLAPPTLSSYFSKETAAKTMNALSEASGLVLVCGPIGGGKTTLAQSIVNHWAKPEKTPSLPVTPINIPGAKGKAPSAFASQAALGRHVMIMGDPIEYAADPDNGVISQIECCLTAANGLEHSDQRNIIDVLPDVLRSDIDALFFGEIRDHIGLNACLDFAGTKEPVIATFHAASISDCIVRAIAVAEKSMTPGAARLTLAACLDAVMFVNVVYNSKGEAVPVVEYLPIAGSARRAITESDPNKMVQAIETEQKNGNSSGIITRAAAVSHAMNRGLSDPEIVRALGRLIYY